MSDYIKLKKNQCLITRTRIHFSIEQFSILKNFGFLNENIRLSEYADDNVLYIYKTNDTRSPSLYFEKQNHSLKLESTNFNIVSYQSSPVFKYCFLFKNVSLPKKQYFYTDKCYCVAKFSIEKQNISLKKSTYVLKLTY